MLLLLLLAEAGLPSPHAFHLGSTPYLRRSTAHRIRRTHAGAITPVISGNHLVPLVA